ncbi:MAG TPA: acyl-CoA dehydrogenase family protein [Acidimicrobiales bacterium]
MDLSLTPDHARLRAAARAAFAAGGDPPLVAGPLTELAIVARELGRAAVPSPFHADVLARLLGWDDPDRAAVALDVRPPAPSRDPTGVPGGPPTLTGVADFVPHAGAAAWLLVPLGPDAVAQVDRRGPGVAVTPQATIADDARCRVELSGAPVVRTWAADVTGATARAAVVLAADAVGAAEAALDAAVAHVSERRQWGAPLGTRQAVQHRCADMLIDVTQAADAVLDAAGVADRGAPEAEVRLAASAAKATALPRCRRVTAAAHQLAGGQGVLADRPFHRWYRRVKAAEPTLGDVRAHRDAVATALLAGETLSSLAGGGTP